MKENLCFTISNVALPASKDELVIMCFLRQRSLAFYLRSGYDAGPGVITYYVLYLSTSLGRSSYVLGDASR